MGMGKQRDVGNAVGIAAESWVPEQIPIHHGQRLLAMFKQLRQLRFPRHAPPAESAGC